MLNLAVHSVRLFAPGIFGQGGGGGDASIEEGHAWYLQF